MVDVLKAVLKTNWCCTRKNLKSNELKIKFRNLQKIQENKTIEIRKRIIKSRAWYYRKERYWKKPEVDIYKTSRNLTNFRQIDKKKIRRHTKLLITQLYIWN